MQINSLIYQTIIMHNNMITTAQVLELGFSKMLLTKYVQNGLLMRLRQGIYTLSEEIHDDMYTLMTRSANIIFSHESALFLNGLSDRTPFIHSVTIPARTSLSASLRSECNCYYIMRELHGLGLTTRKTTFGNEVRCYDAERTICDIIRSRNRLDEETFVMAIRNYASSPAKNINRLAEYADKMGILAQVRRVFEVLL
ncbi:MAG: type IV toxin-antitoxin system AbiEi family antitoxin domain-containing protein [Bacteroidales bacterium]|nr:type IV toxin-antitoxin system AbiEi family antitoxin domain-containing protein [Bacteroidales bacterium]